MQNNFFYLIHKFWKFHWDQACMASATASKTLGGQTQNLCNIIDLVSWETKLKKKMHSFSLRNYSNNIMDFFKTQILNWKMSWDKKIFSKDSNFDTKIQKHWNQIRRIHNNFVCKFWIWPPIVLEAVAEAILAWSQWNFQNLKVRY